MQELETSFCRFHHQFFRSPFSFSMKQYFIYGTEQSINISYLMYTSCSSFKGLVSKTVLQSVFCQFSYSRSRTTVTVLLHRTILQWVFYTVLSRVVNYIFKGTVFHRVLHTVFRTVSCGVFLKKDGLTMGFHTIFQIV